MEQNRIQKGIRTAGQFAATTHAEPAADLPKALNVHQRTHAGLVGDQFSHHEEAQAARATIHESLAAGQFGDDSSTVNDLADNDRLIRLAVDRYVVAEHYEPGTFQPEETGHRLGRLLMDLHAEDIDDSMNVAEGENA